MDMSDQVRRAIRNCGLTQYEIAKRTGMTQGALSRFMAGDRDMTLRTLDRIAVTIGVKLTVGRPQTRRKGR